VPKLAHLAYAWAIHKVAELRNNQPSEIKICEVWRQWLADCYVDAFGGRQIEEDIAQRVQATGLSPAVLTNLLRIGLD
jgi:hypothetical protein